MLPMVPKFLADAATAAGSAADSIVSAAAYSGGVASDGVVAGVRSAGDFGTAAFQRVQDAAGEASAAVDTGIGALYDAVAPGTDGCTEDTGLTQRLAEVPWQKCALIGGGAIVGVCAVPVGLSATGFTAGGIAAGSYASSMMSAAAVAGGGGVAAGSGVALLQSAGAGGAGLLAFQAAAGTAGAAVATGGVVALGTSATAGDDPKDDPKQG